jgi:hypothetical protein
MQKRSRRISTMPSEQLYVENQLSLDVYCSIQPRSLAVNFDSGFVDRDPRRRSRRRVRNAFSQPMYPIPNRTVRPFYLLNKPSGYSHD